MTTEDMVKQLKSDVYAVTFVKNNGDKRVMHCTLKPDVLPYVSATNMSESVIKNDYLPVWDIEENAWRAFKPSRVVAFKALKE